MDVLQVSLHLIHGDFFLNCPTDLLGLGCAVCQSVIAFISGSKVQQKNITHIWSCAGVFLTRKPCQWWRLSAAYSVWSWRSVVSWHHRAGSKMLQLVVFSIRRLPSFSAPTPPSMNTHSSCSKVLDLCSFDAVSGCPLVLESHGKSLNLGRPFSRPGKSWKTAKVMESPGKWWQCHGIFTAALGNSVPVMSSCDFNLLDSSTTSSWNCHY